MTITKVIKVTGALILLLSITLPMSSCTYYVDPDGNKYPIYSTLVEDIPHDAELEVVKRYALDDLRPLEPGFWIIALMFTWPLITLGALQWRPMGRLNLALRGFELLLLGASAWFIDFISTVFADRREIGAYVAFIGLGLYAIGTIWSDILKYRSWRDERRT